MFNKFISYIKFKTFHAIVLYTMALFFLTSCNVANNQLIIYNNDNKVIASFPINKNDFFSIGFIHSVNNSPVIEYYNFDKNKNLYVFKTIYYNYGAGVETSIQDNEVLKYGDDGSMIIDNMHRKIENLTYYLSSIHDHILKINDGNEISLWKYCGKNSIITIKIK